MTNQAIAERLGLSTKTVAYYVSIIVLKLGADDRLKAAQIVRESLDWRWPPLLMDTGSLQRVAGGPDRTDPQMGKIRAGSGTTRADCLSSSIHLKRDDGRIAQLHMLR